MKAIDRLNQDWLLATEVHKLEARLWRRAQREKLRVIMITSADRGEGKSTTAGFLVTALALHPDRKILAIDFDFREPKLNTHFEAPVSVSVGMVLRGEATVKDALIKTTLPNLDLLLPFDDGDEPDLLLRTTECSRLFDEVRQTYDFTLVDVPALIPVADASGLLPLVDGVVLMAMAGKTSRPHLSRAREICLGMEAKILGLIIGNLQESPPEYGHSGYDYGYHYGHKRSAKQSTEP